MSDVDTPINKRARHPKQKEARREALLNAAFELFLKGRGDLPKVADITRQCGLAKGTAYLYFDTKEAIYLALLEQQQTAWLTAVRDSFRRPGQPPLVGHDAISYLITSLLSWNSSQPHLFALAAQLQPVIEPAIDAKALLAYRTRIAQQFKQTAEKIQTFLDLPVGRSVQPTLLESYAILLGCWTLGQAPAALSRVMQSTGGSASLKISQLESSQRLLTWLWSQIVEAHQGGQKPSGLTGWFNRKS